MAAGKVSRIGLGSRKDNPGLAYLGTKLRGAFLPSLQADVRKCLAMKIHVLGACEQLTHC